VASFTQVTKASFGQGVFGSSGPEGREAKGDGARTRKARSELPQRTSPHLTKNTKFPSRAKDEQIHSPHPGQRPGSTGPCTCGCRRRRQARR